MFVDNNWYGQRTVLSKYCNKKDSYAFAAIQHGMLTTAQEELLGKRRFSIIPYLCWNKRVYKKLKNQLEGPVFTIFTPFKKNLKIGIFQILESQMHGIGTPSDLDNYLNLRE